MVDARYLVDYASDAAFAVDDSLKIVAWNYGARRILGYTRREVLGRKCAEILQAVLPDGQPLCVPSCEGLRCFRRFKPFVAASCYARGKDGGWVPVNLASIVMSRRLRNAHTRSGVAVVFLRGDEDEHDRPLTEEVLQIFTFGRFGLAAGGHGLAVERWERKQALTLLKFLVAHLGCAVPREVLIECLWPDVDERRGRERLKVTVYFLRRQLRAAGMRGDLVETAGEAYLLRREAVWVDTEAFERRIADGSRHQDRGRRDEALECYGAAQRLYRGDYMGEDIHADWCAEERERLREVHLEMLASMAECHAERGRFAEAALVCRTILVDDPCREGIHRALMGYLVRLGKTDLAVAQYHHCRRVLAHELDAEPMPETHDLFRQIIEGEARASIGKAVGTAE